jgi:hypothetical protein
MSETLSSRKSELISTLIEARTYLNRVLDRVGDRWETSVYSDGAAWNVRQLVAHLVDADRGHNNQVMSIAEGRDLIPENFDVERYNLSRTAKNADKTPEQCRNDLENTRAELLAWLQTVDEEKLDRQGRHASLRIMSVHDIVRLSALHELGHAQDIARALNINVSTE